MNMIVHDILEFGNKTINHIVHDFPFRAFLNEVDGLHVVSFLTSDLFQSRFINLNKRSIIVIDPSRGPFNK